MSVPPTLDLQGLLAEDQWMRRLARRLAGDGHAAEDLVQETWVAALDARCPQPRALRPWLRGILRNLWIDAQSARRARGERERAVARDEALDGASELVAELELRKSVAEALLALEEPYRRALYLRFFKDQSLAAIAAREGLALSTVHERIQTGLERLRLRLDRERGGRRAWAVGLLALVEPARGSLVAAVETMAMAGALKVAASILVVGAGVAWWWSERTQPERATLTEAPAPPFPVEQPPQATTLASVQAPAGVRAELPTSGAARPLAVPSVNPEPRRIEGHVLDAHGSPVAQVAVGWSAVADEARTLSRVDGSFTIAERHEHDARIVCLDPGFVTLVPGTPALLGSARDELVVVAPRAAFAGLVLAPEGTPVPGARVSFRLRDALFRELGVQRRPPGTEEARTSTDADGRFALADLAGGEHVFLQVEAAGFLPAEVALPVGGALDLVLVLERNQRGLVIRGFVLDARAAPVEGAQVSAGHEIVRSDAAGHFELRTHAGPGPFDADGQPLGPTPDTVLAALKAGFQPARVLLRDLDLASAVELTLGAKSLSIQGRVLDAQGRPRRGIVLWARDPTPFGRQLDSVAEGTTIAWEKTIEDELVGGYGKRGTRSDEHGAFELTGLIERTYALMAFDPETAELAGPWTFSAPSRAVELVFAREEPRSRVAGRLVSTSGRPIPGVSVSAQRAFDWHDAHSQPPFLGRHEVETDAQGRFEFAELALANTELLLESEPFFLRTVALADHPDPEHLELVEPLLCELQVDLSGDPAFADELRVLDGEGHELQTIESFGNGFSLGTQASITNGLSGVVVTKETAATLVLFQHDVEVLRRPLRLDPDQRTTVRP